MIDAEIDDAPVVAFGCFGQPEPSRAIGPDGVGNATEAPQPVQEVSGAAKFFKAVNIGLKKEILVEKEGLMSNLLHLCANIRTFGGKSVTC